MPLLNEFLYETYPTQQATSASLSSAVMNSAILVGDLVGPIIGGTMSRLFGFPRACSIAACFMLINTLLLLPLVVQKHRRPKPKK
jgi:predicted MFS family arabinose efflux permease